MRYYVERSSGRRAGWTAHSKHRTLRVAKAEMRKAIKKWPLSDWRVTELLIHAEWP